VSRLNRDKAGPYRELRIVSREILDATVLRVSKKMYKAGIQMLHGQNAYHFR
jgi:hypothetical protein